MSVQKWQFLVADNRGNVLGELNQAKERKVNLPMGRITNGSLVVDVSNPWANTLRKGDVTFIKAYRTNSLGTKKLMGYGPVINTQKTRASGAGSQVSSLVVNWAGIAWRVERRLIEASKTAKGLEYGTPEAPIETGQIAVKIIEDLNNGKLETGVGTGILHPYNVEHPILLETGLPIGPLPQADTGIRIGNIGPTPTSTVGPWYFQNALSGISLVASTFSGFDWEVEPVEAYVDSLGIVFGKLNLAAAFGSHRADVVWEYGTGKNNVREFTELIDSSGNLNRAYSEPTGFPENATEEVIMQYDWNAIRERNYIYDDIIPSDIVAQDLRNELLKEHVNVRKQPKTVITFKPTSAYEPGVIPEFGTEYGLGDIFTFRSVEYGQETFNGLVRMYEAQFEIDENGNETITPILISQEV
jgi:hypothetical protein